LPMPLPLCWLCRNFIGRLEASIPKEAAAAAVSRLCRVLPVAVAGTCQCLAERYTVLVLEAVLEHLGPRLLCPGGLGRCPHCSPWKYFPQTRQA
uniref:Saposin B-type domain-containing protein n=1 Tax=Anser brachyrhynchus TaxID=132585 RepID=A0A8B9C3B3_9AVES